MTKKIVKVLIAILLVLTMGLTIVSPIFNSNRVSADSFNTVSGTSGGILQSGLLSSSDTTLYGDNVRNYIFYKYLSGYNFDYTYYVFNNDLTSLYCALNYDNVQSVQTMYIVIKNILLDAYNYLLDNEYISSSSVSGTVNFYFPFLRSDSNNYYFVSSVDWVYSTSTETIDFDDGAPGFTALTTTSNSSQIKCLSYALSQLNSKEYNYASYLSSTAIYNNGYTEGYNAAKELVDTLYQDGYNQAKEYYENDIETNYVSKSSYDTLNSTYQNLVSDYNELNNSDINLTFTGLLKDIIDYPVTFIKKVFSHEVTTTTGSGSTAVTTTEWVPYEVLGIEVGNLCLGFFAICLTFGLIGVVKKFVR